MVSFGLDNVKQWWLVVVVVVSVGARVRVLLRWRWVPDVNGRWVCEVLRCSKGEESLDRNWTCCCC